MREALSRLNRWTLVLVALSLSIATPALAKKKKKKPPADSEQSTSQPNKSPTTSTTPAATEAQPEKASGATTGANAASKSAAAAPEAAIDSSLPSEKLLEMARAKYADLEYDDVVRLSKAVLGKSGVPSDQQLEAYVLEGSALAGSDQAIDAERPFRMMLRLKNDFELPKDTQPKIMAVFRKVQAEEVELARQSKALVREKLVRNMALLGDPPERGWGGYPVHFHFRLRDPTGATEAMVITYKASGQAAFSTLALQRDEAGEWVGAIPGEQTTNADGLKLEYYVESRDAQGPLVTRGSADKPLALEVSAGTTVRERPPPLAPWAFWLSSGVTAAAALSTGGLAFATHQAQQNYNTYVSGPVLDAGALQTKAQSGQRLALGTNIGIGVTAAGVVVTAIISRFVNWDHVPEPPTPVVP
jgi:hypothetical protein